MLSIAGTLGFRDYRLLWKANDKLRASRPNPNMLVLGDTVEEPEKAKVETRFNGRRYTFVVPASKSASLRIILLGDDGEPLKDAAWELATMAKKGTTLADGLIEQSIPVTETNAVLKVTPKKTVPVAVPDPPSASPTPYPAPIKADQFTDKLANPDPDDDFVEWTLKIGSLPSFNHSSGVLARLHNLGAGCDPDDDGSRTERTVKAYQKVFLNQSNGSGKPSDVQEDLRDRHDNKP
jgi:hypothetical protein